MTNQAAFAEWVVDFAETISDFASDLNQKLEEMPRGDGSPFVLPATEVHTYTIEVPAGTMMPGTWELEQLVRSHFGAQVTITAA